MRPVVDVQDAVRDVVPWRVVVVVVVEDSEVRAKNCCVQKHVVVVGEAAAVVVEEGLMEYSFCWRYCCCGPVMNDVSYITNNSITDSPERSP